VAGVAFARISGLKPGAVPLPRMQGEVALSTPFTRLPVSIQAALAVLLLVALGDCREAGSGDVWKRRYPGVWGGCVAERGLSRRNPAASTLSSLRGIPASPGSRG
jgi:hypothetical protein